MMMADEGSLIEAAARFRADVLEDPDSEELLDELSKSLKDLPTGGIQYALEAMEVGRGKFLSDKDADWITEVFTKWQEGNPDPIDVFAAMEILHALKDVAGLMDTLTSVISGLREAGENKVDHRGW